MTAPCRACTPGLHKSADMAPLVTSVRALYRVALDLCGGDEGAMAALLEAFVGLSRLLLL